MTRLVIDALLAFSVAACWLGAAGFVRLTDPRDRLHCASFVNVAAGLSIALASFVADGLSTRSLKLVLLEAALLLNGAVLAHATGRMVMLRYKD